MDKIKINLNGSAETMLQSFYARAQYSKSKRHKFYDAKAVELVDRIDYDFSSAEKDSTMGTGVIARTRGMTRLFPILKPFAWIPYIKKVTQKIIIFEKKSIGEE